MSFTNSVKNLLRNLSASLLLFSICTLPALAEEMWEELFQENLEEAQGGEPDAQYEVGIMYLKGQGVQPDRAKAVSWLEKAAGAGHEQAESKLRRVKEQEAKFSRTIKSADDGDARAQYEVAMMYLKGRGVEQSGSKARKWLAKAAEQNDEKATARLGILYYKGEGGKKDYQEAARLFNRIKETSALAQYYLGGMYAHGKGVEKNYETAIAWYKKAADGGFDMARGNIINLEEELKMQERRKKNLVKQEAEAKKAPIKQKVVKKQVKTEIKKTPAPRAPTKQKTKVSLLDKLAARNWARNNKPVEYMPSKITECEKDKNELICFSEVLNRMSGTQSVEYRVKSVIKPGSDKVSVLYRNLVINVENTQDSDDQPLGYDDEQEQGFTIKTGWTKEHSVECAQPRGKAMECMKDKTHQISLVGD